MGIKLGSILMLSLGLIFVIHGEAEPASSVTVSITSPADGFITVSPEVDVRGLVTLNSTGTAIALVIVSVNGEPQKASIEKDGTFTAQVPLQKGSNLISVIATTDDKNFASAKIFVTGQNEILYKNDFSAKELGPEWAQLSGTWKIVDDPNYGKVLKISEDHWDQTALIYLNTDGSQQWRDYAIELDMYNARSSDRHGFDAVYQELGVVLRAKDEKNQILLRMLGDSICWFTVQNGAWNGCIGAISPGIGETQHRLRIEARGDTFTLFVNGLKRTEFTVEKGFTEGMPGFWIKHHIDGSFANIKIESLAPGTPAPEQAAANLQTEQPATSTQSQSQLTDLQGVKDHLEQLEPEVNALKSQLASNQGNLSDLKAKIANWEQDITTLKTSFASLSGLQQSDSGQSTEISTRIQAIQKSLDAMAGKVNENNADVKGLEKDIQQANGMAQIGLIAILGTIVLALIIIVFVRRIEALIRSPR